MSRIFIFYIFFLLIFTVFTYLFVDYNFSYLKNLYTGFYTDHRFITSFFYAISIMIFFIFYILFLKTNLSLVKLKFVILSTVVILFFSYPAMLSYDIFNYVATSKVLFTYHENPYIIMPLQFIGDPILQFTRATNKIALYGPLWIIISAIPSLIGFGNFLFTLFGFKLLSAVFYLATSFLIYKITKSTFSTAIFALNPLVIIESLVSSHYDFMIVFLALLAFYLLSKAEKIKGFLFLLLSIMIKYATLFLVPLFLYEIIQLYKKRNINLKLIYFAASLSMLSIFLLSPLREEIYPWYGIWFLGFVSIIPNNKTLLYFSFGLSMGLMLSYLPFMFLGTYFESTPMIKYSLIFVFGLIGLILASGRRLWLRKFFLS